MSHMSDVDTWTVQIRHVFLCEDITDPDECVAANCFWYNNSCHSSPQKKEEIPWLLYAGIATVVVGGIAVIIKRWR